MSRRPHSAFRRAAWLALVALFLQIMVPVLHHPASAAQRGGIAAADLCLAPGSLPQAPTDTDKHPAHKLPACSVCLTLHMLGGGFVPPGSLAYASVPTCGAVLAPIAVDSLPQGRVVSDARARAPPERA